MTHNEQSAYVAEPNDDTPCSDRLHLGGMSLVSVLDVLANTDGYVLSVPELSRDLGVDIDPAVRRHMIMRMVHAGYVQITYDPAAPAVIRWAAAHLTDRGLLRVAHGPDWAPMVAREYVRRRACAGPVMGMDGVERAGRGAAVARAS